MSAGKPFRIAIESLGWDAADPLAKDYHLVSQVIAQIQATGWHYYSEPDFETVEAGRQMLAAEPAEAARLVEALIAFAAHGDGQARQVRGLAKTEAERHNFHNSPEWPSIWPVRQLCLAAIKRLLRRKLPLGAGGLKKMTDWIAGADQLTEYWYPLKTFTKAVENFGEIPAAETELRAALANLAKTFNRHHDKSLPRLANQIEAALKAGPAPPVIAHEIETPPILPQFDASQTAPAGAPGVLVQLKQFLALLPKDGASTTEIGLDHFPLRADTALKAEHELVTTLVVQTIEQPRSYDPKLEATAAGRAILSMANLPRSKVLLALAERNANVPFVSSGGLEDYRCAHAQAALGGLFSAVLKTALAFERNSLFDILLFLSALSSYQWSSSRFFLDKLLPSLENLAKQGLFSAGERHVLYRLRCRSVRTCPFGQVTADTAALHQLLGDNLFISLVPGEEWSDMANADLARMAGSKRSAWLQLLRHAAGATTSRPSDKWLEQAAKYAENIGVEPFTAALQRWFAVVKNGQAIRTLKAQWSRDGADLIHDDNATVLRGLIWMSPDVAAPEMIRSLGELTVSCYKKVPGVGPRAPKVANAGVYALSQIDDSAAVGQLALLKVKVKSGSAQKEIEKAFTAAAERSGLPRDEIEEMSVPIYGLNAVGQGEEEMGEFTARLSITGTTSTELIWLKSGGKAQKAVPASVKEQHKEELKELQAAAKDIQQMLPAQRERIDSLFLQQKSWAVSVWRERYLDHPLIGTLARRILWDFTVGGKTVTGIWFNSQLVDLDLRPVDLTNASAIQLWHPIGKSLEETTAWRSFLDAQQIQQPFKQAHREIYLLTDAERNTRTYSNRFAAHVLKQHQFNALCAARGWKNKLRLLVDDTYPPASRLLPKWNLRAEFWIEGIGANYGNDTNDSGVFHYVSTDQVRFYRIDAAQRTAHAGGGGYEPAHRAATDDPVPLEEIPPLVLSEILRDVDLFVGVASVGNDPAWNDGGPNGRYQQYWRDVSFGELNASAKTRKDVLQRLIPKLRIAARCSFEDKFLIVKGSLRTYKIHLGSGNILMEPNDQYLCIVPKQGDKDDSGVLLPFEGDRTLSVIISKAFMLAADIRIKDETIIRQITLAQKS